MAKSSREPSLPRCSVKKILTLPPGTYPMTFLHKDGRYRVLAVDPDYIDTDNPSADNTGAMTPEKE